MFRRIICWLSKRYADPAIYAIRYKDCTSDNEWTFPEACKMMRAIPVRDRMEVLLPTGEVNFTLPPRK